MIASLRGTVLTIGLDHAVLDCAGVGYKVLATPASLAGLTRGEEASVLTEMVVKEDSMTLFGFSNDQDRAMFTLLQTVSGLGPKLAMAALSVLSAQEIAQAIAAGDAKKLQTIPGVGKRMAERLNLELKDKVGALAGAEEPTPEASSAQVTGPAVDTVVEALVGLGFTDKLARPAVEAVAAESPGADTSTLLRTSLAHLSAKR